MLADIVHAAVAILFVAASYGHMYIGTIGAEGTFAGIWKGSVDAAWARQHQDLWFKEKLQPTACSLMNLSVRMIAMA